MEAAWLRLAQRRRPSSALPAPARVSKASSRASVFVPLTIRLQDTSFHFAGLRSKEDGAKRHFDGEGVGAGVHEEPVDLDGEGV